MNEQVRVLMVAENNCLYGFVFLAKVNHSQALYRACERLLFSAIK